ncbi:hypothetical protein [Cerasicoccus fimbriatus]|uniref:hypothetical protein n=1 Tax=Cerasicoccus fimbriatus TaxID=3014554 RepID=UPI0022B400E3|nr:hypothetical protein [Cerasicoccus sp. TK19100]
MPEHPPVESRAWLLLGPVKSLPGALLWDGQRVTFVACGTGSFSESDLREIAEANALPAEACESIFAEKPTPLIVATPAEISGVKMPWYYFKGGIQITVRNHGYKFSFIRPQNTVEPTYYLEDQFRWTGGAGQEDVDIAGGKTAGAKWKQLLTALTQ